MTRNFLNVKTAFFLHKEHHDKTNIKQTRTHNMVVIKASQTAHL